MYIYKNESICLLISTGRARVALCVSRFRLLRCATRAASRAISRVATYLANPISSTPCGRSTSSAAVALITCDRLLLAGGYLDLTTFHLDSSMTSSYTLCAICSRVRGGDLQAMIRYSRSASTRFATLVLWLATNQVGQEDGATKL